MKVSCGTMLGLARGMMTVDALLFVFGASHWTLPPSLRGCSLFDDTRGYMTHHVWRLDGVDCFLEHTASMHR